MVRSESNSLAVFHLEFFLVGREAQSLTSFAAQASGLQRRVWVWWPANNLRTIGAEYGAKPSCEVREKTFRTDNII
jgi:hypothetical protein